MDRKNTVRLAAAALAGIAMMCVCPGAAHATFHLMKIVEVFPGTAEQPEAQYVMLQMYSPGQNFVGGHGIEVFAPDGSSAGSFTFPTNVGNGANQATILIGTTQAASLFQVVPDLEMDAVIDAAGGKVCYGNFDCVSWGSFSGSSTTPSPSGTPFNATGGLTQGLAMRRDIGKDGNPSTLSAADDTNDSASDFLLAAPMPKNNQGQTGLPTPTATTLVVSPTPTPTGTAIPSPSPNMCGGYCNGSGGASPEELVTLASIALGEIPLSSCQPGDINGDHTITVDEIITAVALHSCA